MTELVVECRTSSFKSTGKVVGLVVCECSVRTPAVIAERPVMLGSCINANSEKHTLVSAEILPPAPSPVPDVSVG